MTTDTDTESGLTAREALEKAIYYFQLKKNVRMVIPETGEAFDPQDYDKLVSQLNAELKAYIDAHDGEPIHGEGLPQALTVQPKSNTWYRLDLLAADNPEMFDWLLQEQLVKLDIKAVDALVRAGAPNVQGITKYREQGQGAPSLVFERVRS